MPKLAASGGGRCAGQAAQSPPGRHRAAALTCPRSPACAHLPAQMPRRQSGTGNPARAGSGFLLSPWGAVLLPAPAGFGDQAGLFHAALANGSRAMWREPQAAACSSQRLALLPDPAHCSGLMGDPGGRLDPTPATHLGSKRVPGEERVKLSQRQKSEDYRFVAGLSHLSPAQRRALSRAGLSAKSPPLH